MRRDVVEESRAELRSLCAAARTFDIRHFEEVPPAEVREGLSRPVQQLLERALGVAGRLLEHYDHAEVGPAVSGLAEEGVNFELAIDSVLAERSPESKVADLAFMAQAELRQRLARVAQHAADGSAWEMVCDAGSALRRLQKSVGALELAVCEVEGLAPELRYDSELQTSLEIRRQYRKLWRFVRQQGEVTPDGVRNALRGGGTLIAMLVGSNVYTRLREGDRFHLRQQQRCILAWLVQEEPDRKAGVRLWQDFAGMVEMFRQVNLRQELAAHDARTLAEVEPALRRGDELSHERVRGALERLRGLDDELDQGLDDHAPPAVLHAAVARLKEHFEARGRAGGAF